MDKRATDVFLGKRIGAALDKWKRETGNNQQDLAELIGVDCGTVSRWRTGRQRPDRESMERLCEVLGIEEIELVRTPSRYEEFIEFVLDEIWDEDSWEMNHKAFPDIVCRKLIKLQYPGITESAGYYERVENE